MHGFSILMCIFGVCVLLVGLYMFTGHKVGILTGRVAFRKLTINDWKKIGKYTIIVSFFILLLALIGYIFNF